MTRGEAYSMTLAPRNPDPHPTTDGGGSKDRVHAARINELPFATRKSPLLVLAAPCRLIGSRDEPNDLIGSSILATYRPELQYSGGRGAEPHPVVGRGARGRPGRRQHHS